MFNRFFSSRRGVELSMNAIIIIALGLIVLVIITWLVFKSTSNAGKDINGCESKGTEYHCYNGGTSGRCPEGEMGSAFFGGGCPNKGDICCKRA